MSKSKINEKRTSSLIPYDIFDKLKESAQSKGITVSTLIRMLIYEHLEKEEEQKEKD